MRSLTLLFALFSLLAAIEDPSPGIDPWELADDAQPLPARWGTVAGSFTLRTELPGNPQVTARWIRPTDTGQGASPRGDEVVVYLPFARDLDFWKPEDKPWIKRMFFRFAREGGFTVIGLQFDHEAYDAAMRGDPKAPRLWSHPAAHAAIAAAVERLRLDEKLPDLPVFTFGESGGGLFSQAIAESHPGLVDGIASTGGAGFELKGDARCPILALNTAGDYTTQANDQLSSFYQARGVPVLRQLTNMEWIRRGKPDWLPFHCTNEDARQLSLRFHVALSELRGSHGGKLPAASAWPYAVRADDPRRLARTDAGAWKSALGEGPVTMLPSRSFAAAWLRVPQAPRALAGAGAVGWRADPSPLTRPKGVVVRRWHGQAALGSPLNLKNDDQSCALDLRFLSEQGYIAVAMADGWEGTPAALARIGESELPVFAFAPDAQAPEIARVAELRLFRRAALALPRDDDGAGSLDAARSALDRGLPLTLVVATPDGKPGSSPLLVLGDALTTVPRIGNDQKARNVEDVHQLALDAAVKRFAAK